MCIHLPMLFLYWRKCHFLSYSYIRCLIKAPTEQLKIYAYFENSQTAPWGPFDSPEGWVHHKICLAIFGLLLGAIWKQKKWPGQQGGPGKGKNQAKLCVSYKLIQNHEIGRRLIPALVLRWFLMFLSHFWAIWRCSVSKTWPNLT